MMIPSEYVEQREFVSWFKKVYPQVRILAIPNGGVRSLATAGKLKAEGVSPGVPDLYIPEWRVWIEMKRIKNSYVTPEQKEWHEYLRNLGDTVLVCKGSTAAKKAVLLFCTKLDPDECQSRQER